jgi:hypothetical protein
MRKHDVIDDVAEAMVDANHPHAAETMHWLKAQILKIPLRSVEAMWGILWAGEIALENDSYCEHEADLIWRHSQFVALSILRFETGVGEESNPILIGLHLSPKCPCCDPH